MSRVVYNEDDPIIPYDFQERTVQNAIEGKRGQAALRLLIRALDAMPQKRIIDGWLTKDGDVCTVGAMVMQRRIEAGDSREKALGYLMGYQDELNREESWDWADIATLASKQLNIARYMAFELVEITDEWTIRMSPERRWQFVRDWAVRNLKDEVMA